MQPPPQGSKATPQLAQSNKAFPLPHQSSKSPPPIPQNSKAPRLLSQNSKGAPLLPQSSKSASLLAQSSKVPPNSLHPKSIREAPSKLQHTFPSPGDSLGWWGWGRLLLGRQQTRIQEEKQILNNNRQWNQGTFREHLDPWTPEGGLTWFLTLVGYSWINKSWFGCSSRL
jgi:hypothetical protein